MLHLAFLFCVLHAAYTPAQPSPDSCQQQIEGFVIEGGTGSPLPGAVVQAQGKTVATNSRGLFVLQGLCGKSLSLKIEYIGHTTVTKLVQLKGTSTHVDIALREETHQLDEFEIEGQRRLAPHGTSTTNITRQQIEEQSGTSISETISRIPGVNLLRTGPNVAKPVVQGLTGSRILILNQGIRHEGQQWGADHAPELDPMAMGKLTLIKGPATMRYGADALGGVLIAEGLGQPDSTGLTGKVNIMGASNNRMGAASALLSYSPAALPGLYMHATGTARRAGDSHAPTYNLSNTGLAEYNGSGTIGLAGRKAGIELGYSRFYTRLGILLASNAANLTDLNAAIASDRPKNVQAFSYDIKNPYQKVSHDLARAKAYYSFSTSDRIELQVAFQKNVRKEFDKHRPFGVSNYLKRPSVVFDLNTYSAELTEKHSFNQHLHLLTGLSYYYGEKTGNFDASTSRFLLRSLIPNYTSNLIGAFAVLEGENGPYSYTIGARAEQKSYQVQAGAWANQPTARSFQLYSAGAQLVRSLGPHLHVEAGLNTAGRAPSISELYSRGLHHGLASIEVGLPTAKAEQMFSATMGTALKFHKFTATAGIYANRINSFLNLTPAPPAAVTIGGTFPVFRTTQQDAYFLGSDWAAKYAFHPAYAFEGSASFVRVRSVLTNQFLTQMPADRFRLAFIHYGRTVAGLIEPIIRIEGQYVSRQTHLPANYLSDSLDFAAPPSGYFTACFSLSTKFKAASRIMQVGIEGQNILNKRYRDYLDRFRYFADAQGSNFILRLGIPIHQTNKS